MGSSLSVPFPFFHHPMDPAAAPPVTTSRPTHIPLPPPPSFSAFLSTPSPSQRDDPFAEDVQSPYLQFYTAPSTPYSEAEPPQPPSPAAADYFTPPSSPFTEIPLPEPTPTLKLTPVPEAQFPVRPPSPPSPVPLIAPHPANTYVSPSPYGTDDIYPGIPVDIVNDLILDDGSLTALEKIYLFCRSKQVIHRSFIVKNMPKLLHDVPPQEAVEYVLPLFHELVLDPDESVREEFSRSLGDIMWWFLTHCQVVVEDCSEQEDGDCVWPLARVHYQMFTPLFGTLILSSNGNVSESARCSILTVLERIKKIDDRETLARGEQVRPPLPPENLWKAPVQDYAMDDPEIEEEEPDVGLFGPEERTQVKQEILAGIVIALGRLDSLWDEDLTEGAVATTGQSADERRLWLEEAQEGDGVQVVSPDELRLGNDGNSVTTSNDLEASPSNVIILKEDTVNPYFPILSNSFSTPSSTSSTPSTGNSANSSSGSSPTAPVVGVSSLSTSPAGHLPSSDSTPEVLSHSNSSSSHASEGTVRTAQESSQTLRTNVGPPISASPQPPSESYQLPAFLQRQRLRASKGPLAYQLNLGNMIHEEEEDIYYDEQATNGRWSTMRLVAAVATGGTADLDTEIYFIKDVSCSAKDPVYWVRREAVFAIGALARVVPIDLVVKHLLPMFERLVGDPHCDVRQHVLFSLPPLAQRLPFDRRRKLAFETLTALSQDPEITVRESALDTLSETIHAFADDPQGPPEFLLHMYLGRKEDNNVRSGTRLITFEIPPPLEAFYLDTKRPLTLAFGFPAVALTLGKDRWEELRGAYLDLTANRMNDVKRALAAGLGEIAKIIGPENTRRDLVQVWWNSVNYKDGPTRIRAIENLETLIGVVGKELGLLFWEGVLKNWETRIFKGWRERKIILQEMVKMPGLLGEAVLPIVKSIEAQALLDLEQGVRDIAVEQLPKVFGLLSPRRDLLDDLSDAMTQLLSSTFRRRMTFASCQRSIFLASVDSGRKSSEALTDDMLHVMYDLSRDTVTDVRICVARFAGSVCDTFMRESEPLPDPLAEIVQRLSQDSSLSVKSFIPDPATLLCGHSVIFPSSNEVVEPTLAPPMRSRHFSKPPFPRQSSSVSVLSAADLPSGGNHSTDTNGNGPAMEVDRGYAGQSDGQDDDQEYGGTPSGTSSSQPNLASEASTATYTGGPQLLPQRSIYSNDTMDVDGRMGA
ncbi:ARM repeat-containing protein [Macrolepiota fuliginosa MF-IS2]|uniref:ARM repeat-containing protein n=1 Tax=Macrolepiota fuliginosa MF-IS2 TaxID=1400762 RepID=A0A9P5XP32_9AGAR|nr:ARM repeat-containing protein [Macrolepiota fuliginosa MF-IS2]